VRLPVGAGLNQGLRQTAEAADAPATPVVADLSELIPENPLRKRLRGQLMRALHRSGRQPEALEAYRSFRSYLVGEFGVEPSRELQDLHQQILRGDLSATPEPGTPGPAEASASPFPVPRQLPASTGRLSGRKFELEQLDRLGSDTSPVVLVVGAAGVGKTSLVVAGTTTGTTATSTSSTDECEDRSDG
jgi:hypothetical protein